MYILISIQRSYDQLSLDRTSGKDQINTMILIYMWEMLSIPGDIGHVNIWRIQELYDLVLMNHGIMFTNKG